MPRTYREPEYRRRVREKTEQDKQKADTEKRESAQKGHIKNLAAAIHRVEQELYRANDENSPRNTKQYWWEKAGVLGLWIAAAVGVAAIVVSSIDSRQQRKVMRGQLVTMQAAQRQTGETIAALQEQAGIMRNQLAEMQTSSIIAKNQLRAKMRLHLTLGHNAINKQIVNWTVTPDWGNIGQADAISWAGWDGGGFFPGNSANTFDFVADITTGHWKKNVYNVPPGEGVSQTTQFIPRTWAENALAGAGIIIVWGYITWRDIFPDSPAHFRHWCFIFVPIRANGDIAFAEPVIYKPECNRAE